MKKNKKVKKSWSVALKESGLNPKKEIAFIVMTNISLLVMAFFAYRMSEALIAPLSIILLIAVSDFFLLGKASRVKKMRVEELEKEFVHIFSYFKIFVTNGRPVYNALEDCVRYSSPAMSDLLTTLLKDIDADKSVKPYLTFSTNFESVFSSVAAEKRKYQISKFESTLNNNNFLPLADSALTMGLIVVAIVVIMGNLAYGI